MSFERSVCRVLVLVGLLLGGECVIDNCFVRSVYLFDLFL